jgi:preprotein translocase subunit SecE
MENFNRQQKRQMKKMGALTAEGSPTRTQPAPRTTRRETRTSFPQFLREVRAELRKVAWPTRPEVRSYSILVLVVVVVFTTFITLIDVAFGTGALWLFDK